MKKEREILNMKAMMQLRFGSRILVVLLFFVLVLSSCVRHDEALLSRLQEIKEVGNVEPKLAMKMLDSLQNEMDKADRYIWNKYELLSIRLHDKADIPATTDTPINRLVRYFEKHGSMAEKQEAYFYAGSAYSDLQDTPKGLEYFLKSVDCCEKGEETDSVMLRNAYSRLYFLYYYVQDYSNALTMARKEINVAKQLNILDARSIMHEGAALQHLDSLDAAMLPFEATLSYMERTKSYMKYPEELVSLIYYFIIGKKIDKARKCYELIRSDKNFPFMQDLYINIGDYLSVIGQMDSALVYYNKALEEGPTMYDKQTAAKILFRFYYYYGGDKEQLRRYAMRYMELSDTLDFRVRQQEAATTNNRYKYFKNREEELRLQEEKDRYRVWLIGVSALSLVVVFGLLAAFTHRRNRRLRQLLEKTKELKGAREENSRLQEEIVHQQTELSELNGRIRDNRMELTAVHEELERSETELARAKEEVASRLEQNRHILQMLHQSDFEARAEDVLQLLRKASEGLHTMQADDWKLLHHTVDELYPDLKDRLVQGLGERITEEQLRFCHLLRIGLSTSQIEKLMDMSRATAWRWTKKYEWILEVKDESGI
jgi:tetratricopeptide (TPR) repeat protein